MTSVAIRLDNNIAYHLTQSNITQEGILRDNAAYHEIA